MPNAIQNKYIYQGSWYRAAKLMLNPMVEHAIIKNLVR